MCARTCTWGNERETVKRMKNALSGKVELYRLLSLDFKVSKTGRGVCRSLFDEAETGNFK